ncbi:hypothetical protein ABZ208_37560 [Streptomyces sp. NPDC006208]|uniref:hypothetical protein n=1 Tax=Streptomyces sp. NPDC006208 TaxID=3156734 RepID=UPI0033B05BB6
MSTPTEAPAKGKGGKAAVVAARPFVTGTRTLESEVYSQTVTQTTSTQTLTPYEFQVDGYLSGALIRVTATTAGNSAATAFQADGPFSVLQSIAFEDISGKQVMGPITGWQLYVLNRFGGFVYSPDAKANAVYSVTTGSGATGGSYRFVLRLPVQVRRRDGMGSLPNRNASATFKLKLTVNTSATVYSTAPTAAASINVQVEQHGWATSDNRDYKGSAVAPAPNGVGSLMYTDVETIQLSAGAFNQRMGTFGGLLRLLVFELRDSTGSRAQGESDWPSLFEVEIDKVKLYSRSVVTWDHLMSEDYGLTATAESATAVNTKINGVKVFHWLDDFGLQPGAENSFRYQPVTPSTAIQLIGTIGGSGAHTLTAMKNYLSPVNDDPRQLTGGR